MAQAKKITAKSNSENKKSLIPEKYQNWLYCGAIILLIFIFFGGAIGGGGFNVSDNVASVSFRPFVAESNETGDFPLWMPYIFSGMPGYSALLVTGERIWDVAPMLAFETTELMGAIFSNDTVRVLSYYMIFGIGMFFLMRFKNHERFISFITALAAVFSTSVIAWVMIGHNTKPFVFSMFPFIFILLEKLRIKFSFIYAALLVFAVHVMMEAGHLQMIFYGICAFGIYLVFELIYRGIKKDKPINVIRSAVILAVAGGLAFLMSADRYFSTLEYTPYSTRGSAPIVQSESNKQDQSGGNDYDYATMWSFNPAEMLTFFVPEYYGFGKMDYSGPATGNKDVKIYSYWGTKPIEDAPPYMGIIIFIFAIIGIIIFRRDPFVLSLATVSVFALLLSFGHHMSLLYDIFYNLVPGFNKFRAPSMVLALMQFSFPILAGYGLTGLVKMSREGNPDIQKWLKILFIVVGAFLGLAIIFNLGMKGAYLDAVAATSTGQRLPAEIHNFIWKTMINGWYITAILAVAAVGALWLFVKKKINSTIFFAAIALFVIIDLWRVGSNPMEISDNKIEQEIFKRTDVIDFLKNDNSIYRVADFASASPNMPAYYFLENVNGYHSAKLRVYQDLMDVANIIEEGSTSNIRNPLLWDILNVKYIITDQNLSYNGQFMMQQGPDGKPALSRRYQVAHASQQTGSYVFQNNSVLPRAFFVKSVEKAEPMQILRHLKNNDFDPLEKAFIEKDLPVSIDVPMEGVNAKIVEKEPKYMKIEAEASGNNLLLISEIYYPAGWKALIDGKVTEIHKTNFAFRSVIVPAGKHTVELKFESEKFESGKTYSIMANAITILCLAVGIFLNYRNRNQSRKED